MPDTSERAVSQATRALLGIRGMILSGALRPGERVSELALVDELGISRTPIRTALVRLEEEGFLQPIPGGGYQIRGFSERDIFDAIEIRGTLEGLAARLAAERGADEMELEGLRAIVARIDEALADADGDGFARYVDLNGAFHGALKRLAGSPVLVRHIDRANAHPFASPDAFVRAQDRLPEGRTILTVAQEQHRAVVAAIARREGARAEALMREHARLASRNLMAVLRDREALDLLPGSALIAAG